MRTDLVVIGGGLAGSEAAWQAANSGAKVTMYEMRPKEETAAHKTDHLAEIVCSNSLGSNDPLSAPGMLKEEMRQLHSLIIRIADEVRIPAGTALAVDRDQFARKVTQALSEHPNVKIQREEIQEIPEDALCLIATGPLTSLKLSEAIIQLTQSKNLFFFDAISPIVDADSLNTDRTFLASRYEKGTADYVNCPMDEETYNAFYDALIQADRVQPKSFENVPYFEGCLPIEVMAERGRQTLLFGPLKPVGLIDPKTGKRPYAVLQLRPENLHGSCYNLVGFQTKLTYPEQRRIFRMIPGLEHAEFLRCGSIHRNTFINAPILLHNTLQLKKHPRIFFAGQLVGVEGYVEAAASGGLAGINAARILSGLHPVTPPPSTAHGALLHYITTCEPKYFQPINSNFGLYPPLDMPVRDKQKKRQLIQERATTHFKAWMTQSGLS
ncbi:MAG: methylenetetrahydrofolate--tRNA-(uracil(54)-C(5))-methyltransferase (FADH(2)-oxidizing) TrmFO [Nitrospirota bacterium]|nr:methylenetetrahydrofolate--tRNA-(uracil(54)-C(5))-methyltransferase (FADH(2)-oxidizing) TrmFO [Nitrospirota bacterium]MDH5575100.1 methylenetetrahydrofolate--tRNA-(uracil(54)-C(5))-methyltransferase (FADH(2)-oxidizing) TrmFO [Nitrospirota bacterium]